MDLSNSKIKISDEFLTCSMTPSVLKNLITSLPALADSKVNKWLKKNQVLLRELVAKPSENYLAENVKRLGLLKQIGIKSLSQYKRSFIFKIPRTEYFAQIAGPTHRAWNLLEGKYGFMEKRKQPTTQWFKEHPDIFNHPTYQTISRFAGYQHYKSKNETKKFKNFSIPPIYLKRVPGRPDTLSDENYIAIQKGVNLKPYKEVKTGQNVEYFVGLTDERIKAFLNTVAVINLCDVGNNIYIKPTTGEILYTDMEQYWWSNPTWFFRKCKTDLRWEILRGLKGIGGYNPHSTNPRLTKWSLVNNLVENGKHKDATRIFRLVKNFIIENNLENWSEYKDFSSFFPKQLFSDKSSTTSQQGSGQSSSSSQSSSQQGVLDTEEDIPGGCSGDISWVWIPSGSLGDIPCGWIPGGYLGDTLSH